MLKIVLSGFIFTMCYIGIHAVTRGYRRLQGVTGGYKGLWRITRGYGGLQVLTKDNRNFFLARTTLDTLSLFCIKIKVEVVSNF